MLIVVDPLRTLPQTIGLVLIDTGIGTTLGRKTFKPRASVVTAKSEYAFLLLTALYPAISPLS